MVKVKVRLSCKLCLKIDASHPGCDFNSTFLFIILGRFPFEVFLCSLSVLLEKANYIGRDKNGIAMLNY